MTKALCEPTFGEKMLIRGILSIVLYLITTIYSSFTYAQDEGANSEINKRLDIGIAWGGFYSNETENGKISVFRLLDFNSGAYHISLYKEEFESVPSLETVLNLKPFAWHAPLSTQGLLNRQNIELIGYRPLTIDDLVGYIAYREAHGLSPQEALELANKVISYGKEPPLPIRLEINEGDFQVSINE